MLMGARATYREPDPEAGEMCAEVNRTWVAYIRGTEVRVYEGVAGWLGFVLPKAP
jgi:hypothetical protein